MSKNIELLVNEMINDESAISRMDGDTMEKVVDYLGEEISDMPDDPMMILLNKIGDEAEYRIIAMDVEEFEEEIVASLERGNTYFELEQFIVQ